MGALSLGLSLGLRQSTLGRHTFVRGFLLHPRCEIQASLERVQPWRTWWWRNCGGYRRLGDATHRVPAEFSEKLPSGCFWNLLRVSIIQYSACCCQLHTAETVQEEPTGTRKRSPFLLLFPPSTLCWQNLALCQLEKEKCIQGPASSIIKQGKKGEFRAERQ